MAESKTLTVYKSDIKKIGNATFGRSNNIDKQIAKTSFICGGETANLEEIFLREILSLYGYKIEDAVDFCYPDTETIDIEFITDMPWEEYMALKF